MIHINAGELNKIVIRANDNIVATSSNWLFELQSIQSREKFYFIAQNLSTNNRWMEFLVREITGSTYSLSLTASTPNIELTYAGSYNYKVYETSTFDLIPATHSNVIDWGKAQFTNGEWSGFFFDLDDENTTEIYFDELINFAQFEFGDDNVTVIFDDEVISLPSLITETGEDILSEDGLYILTY